MKEYGITLTDPEKKWISVSPKQWEILEEKIVDFIHQNGHHLTTLASLRSGGVCDQFFVIQDSDKKGGDRNVFIALGIKKCSETDNRLLFTRMVHLGTVKNGTKEICTDCRLSTVTTHLDTNSKVIYDLREES